jgi:hypothetical protein
LNHNLDTKEAQFMRKLKRGSDKYKGKPPFKCFNCGREGHFIAKFPYEKREDNGDEDSNDEAEHNNKNKPYKHKRGIYTKNKIFYSRKDYGSFEESDGYVSDIDKEEFLFMAMDTKSTDK